MRRIDNEIPSRDIDRRIAVLEIKARHPIANSLVPVAGQGEDGGNRLRRRIEVNVAAFPQQAQDVGRRKVVAVMVTHEHGRYAVIRRVAGKDGLANPIRHHLVSPEAVPVQRIEQNLGVAFPHHYAFVGDVGYGGGLCEALRRQQQQGEHEQGGALHVITYPESGLREPV